MSTTSVTGICNLAMRHIGNSKVIGNYLTETSSEAIACRTFFNDAYEEFLTVRNWAFAKKFATLSVVETNPTDEWSYSYQYPSDCLKLRRILDPNSSTNTFDTLGGDRAPYLTPNKRIPFVLGYGDSGTLIYTNQPDAQVEYTVRLFGDGDAPDVSRLPSDCKLALSYLIAYYVAPGLTSGEFGIVEKVWNQYLLKVEQAGSNSLNQEVQQPDRQPEMIMARDGYT